MESNEPKKNHVLYLAVILIAVLILGYFFYKSPSKNVTSQTNNNQSATTTDNGESSVITGSGYTIEQIPINDTYSIPNLDRAIIFPKEMASDVRNIYSKNIAELTALLKKDSTSFNNWMSLAVYLKGIQDYEGAKEIWEYANKAWPDNTVSFANLGDLYGYYLKDNANAEKNYLEAIKVDPKNARLYLALAQFYTEVMNDSAKAKQILQNGLSKVTVTNDIQNMLDSLK